MTGPLTGDGTSPAAHVRSARSASTLGEAQAPPLSFADARAAWQCIPVLSDERLRTIAEPARVDALPGTTGIKLMAREILRLRAELVAAMANLKHAHAGAAPDIDALRGVSADVRWRVVANISAALGESFPTAADLGSPEPASPDGGQPHDQPTPEKP